MDSLEKQFRAIIEPMAARHETKPEHWVHGWDEGFSFCFECAGKKVAELLKDEPDGDYCVDGGWGFEGDSQAFCETCEHPLDNSFTDYACESELDHFEEYGFDASDPSDCYSMDNILGAQLWEGGNLSERIQKIARQVVGQQATEWISQP